MPRRRFELVAGKSARFWEISQTGKRTTVCFGRIGTDGQTKVKEFDSAAAAKGNVETLISQKQKKGYVEVATRKSAGTKSARAPKSQTKTSSTSKTRPKKTKRVVDQPAAEFAKIKARKIKAKNLVWICRLSSSNDDHVRSALADCVELLQEKLGKRCRALLETVEDGPKKYYHLTLKSQKVTLPVLRSIDRGMAECCKRTKVKYVSLGFAEIIYDMISWKTLGAVLELDERSQGDLDCSKLRFDGLYCCDIGEASCSYLRFYPDGECLYAHDMATVAEVARWLRREKKGLILSKGTYTLKASSFSAALEQQEGGVDPVVFKLKGRLTKQGLKVRAWSSYSNEHYEEDYAFHHVKLK